MKRTISMLLVAAMLLSSVLLLASCGGNGEPGVPNVSGKVVSVDLSECQVYFDTNLSLSGQQKANNVVTKLRDMTTLPIRAYKAYNDGEEYTLDGTAILIGDTGYRESNNVINSLGNYGWAISVQGDKIVIAGTNVFLTRAALGYFTENYLNANFVSGKSISLNQSVELKNISSKNVVENDESEYSLVYSKTVDAVTNTNGYGTKDPETQGGAKTDYIYDISVEMRKLMANAAGVKAGTFAVKNDEAAASDFEVLIGNMDREDYKEELNKLSVNQYGVTIKGGKIMLLGWNDVALAGAYDLFKDLINSCAYENEEGETSLIIPTDCSAIESLEKTWDDSFPKPEYPGLYLDGTVDVGNNSVELVIVGRIVSVGCMFSGLTIIPKIITEIIGPIEQSAVKPNPSVSAFLSLRIDATPVPIAIMNGTLIGPVVTPPESNANGTNVSGTKNAITKTAR